MEQNKTAINFNDIKDIRLVKAMKSAASSSRREIPDDFKYNTKKLKHLKAILHNISVALGTLSSALNEFSKMKGPEISPDGLLGGVGYIIPLKEIKQTINTTVHSLSEIADCLADELTNPKWQATDDKEVKKLIEEKDEVQEQVDDEINPDDVSTPAPSPEENIDQKRFASAVRKSLISFIR